MSAHAESLAIPEPTRLSREAIYNIGEKFSEAIGYKPGADLHLIVKSLGGEIRYVDDWTIFDNETLRVAEGKFEILISRFTNPLRDRFTIAHELGHYVLHSRFGEKDIIVKRVGSGQLEWEANWFAAGFLMPERVFRKQYKQHPDVDHLSRFFKVSTSAISVRMDYLNLGKESNCE